MKIGTNNSRHVGFTIVELLIVIVVIGILAAFVMSSFANVQVQARNASVLNGMKAYQKALLAYGTEKTVYPSTSRMCLGGGYPSNNCWSGPNGTYGINSAFDSAIAPYIGSTKPGMSPKTLQVTNSPDYRSGALFIGDQLKVIYYLEGANQKCQVGPATAVNELNTTQCHLTLPDPAAL